MLAQLATSGVRCLIFGLSFHLLRYVMMRKLKAQTRLCGFTGCSEPWQITNTINTKNLVRWTIGSSQEAPMFKLELRLPLVVTMLNYLFYHRRQSTVKHKASKNLEEYISCYWLVFND